ncbi:ribosomal protein S5 domain 2-type protein [Tribonema minus]|uniref:Ribosomal protein S5 domain 2-type protein n=1 Tax=Tribonema minus TaxID=303371 RepID=A0A835ZF16_9STRA|nr:ribosomal protein S5 domain 2-type protein [Tribonema minus]
MRRRLRFDGRTGDQIRGLFADQGILNRADGSVRFGAGNTSVLVAVYGPAQPAQQKKEKPDRAIIEVSWRADKGAQTSADAERELYVRRTLEEAVAVARYPRSVISVVVQVLCDDGSVLSAAINACAMALVDAGVEMIGMPVAATACFSGSGSAAAAAPEQLQHLGESHLQLDPSASEEATTRATVMLAVLAGSDGILTMKMTGQLGAEELFAASEAARKACDAVSVYLRRAVEAKVLRDVANLQ